MCARSRRRTQSLFGCLGMKNYPLFFSRARRGASNSRRAYRVFYRCALKIKRRKYLSVFFSLEKFLFLFANKNARLVFVRSSCASVNYIIKVSYPPVVEFAIFFFSLRESLGFVSLKKSPPNSEKRAKTREREREKKFLKHIHQQVARSTPKRKTAASAFLLPTNTTPLRAALTRSIIQTPRGGEREEELVRLHRKNFKPRGEETAFEIYRERERTCPCSRNTRRLTTTRT